MFTMILSSCEEESSNGSQNSNDTQNSNEKSIDGVDYRPILGKNYNSDEVRIFFIENKISTDNEYLRIKLDDYGNIEQIYFKEKCPPQSMPFGSSFLLTQKLAKKKYGEPSFIFNRTFVYDTLNLGIQFSQDQNKVDDIGVFTSSILQKIKLRR